MDREDGYRIEFEKLLKLIWTDDLYSLDKFEFGERKGDYIDHTTNVSWFMYKEGAESQVNYICELKDAIGEVIYEVEEGEKAGDLHDSIEDVKKLIKE